MIQTQEELENWYSSNDPWQYEGSIDDQKRKDILISELPQKKYQHVLDIGCGHGYVTRDLPGKEITGVDISTKAIQFAQQDAKKRKLTHLYYQQANLFDLSRTFQKKFDLIIITGVLYPQYINQAHNLIYLIIDQLLTNNGILVSVHISDWYKARFPYLKLKDYFYSYLKYMHHLEIYTK